MKRLQIFGLFILLSVKIFGQINMTDSTAQVIGYWDKNEKQSYIVTQEKYKIKDSDTTSRDFYKYAVDITIVDSTANSYTIDWFYKDYEIQSENALIQKLASITNDMNVRIRTNELGVFQEVINWKDVRDYILKGTRLLKKETKDIPNMDNFMNQLEGMYSTKESIELGAVKEMQQFYTFHGAKYEYGNEYNADMKVASLYGGEPFDTKMTVWLDELNPDDNNFIIRMNQTVNAEQLTNATFDYLVKMAETLKMPAPKREDIPEVSNDTYTASRIHGSGWIIYSIETKETKAEDQTNIEERVIEIK
ncbi:MAG: hypothetical protein K0M40_07445 [Prolixibacteraceae bacterium]|nr:hypothetical protein [Prolixibacteraceae bacterium]